MKNYSTLPIIGGIFLSLLSIFIFSYVGAQEGLPDLLISNPSLTADRLVWTTGNAGVAAVLPSQPINVRVSWLRADGTQINYWTSGFQHLGGMAAGGRSVVDSNSYSSLRDYVVGAPAGAVRLRIVADHSSGIPESDETNNSVELPRPLPDLRIADASFDFERLIWTTVNSGTAPVRPDQPINIRLSWLRRDGSQISFWPGGFQHLGGMPAGDSYIVDSDNYEVMRTFLGDIPSDAVKLRILADRTFSITESNEENNLVDLELSSNLSIRNERGGGRVFRAAGGSSSEEGSGGSGGASGGSGESSGSGVSPATWSPVVSGVSNDLNSVACPSDRICYIVGGAPFIGGNGIILKTTNGGDSWVSQSIPTTNPLRGISCLSADLCYAAGDGGALLKTVNGGSAWTALARNTEAGEQFYWDIAAADANNVTAVGNAGIIYRTVNGGTSWARVTSGTSENLHNVHFANGAIGWVVGTAGKVLKTINGGLSWSSLSPPSGLNGLFSISSRGNKLWVGGDVGRIIKSDNLGLGWTTLRPDTISTLRALYFLDEVNGFSGGGTIRRTTDGGSSWVDEYVASVILRGVACPSAAVCYAVGDDGTILRRGSAPAAGDVSSEVSTESGGSSGGGLNFGRVARVFRNLFGAREEAEESAQGPDPDRGESTPRPNLSPEAARRIAGAVRNLFEENLSAEQRRGAEAPSKRNRATTKIRGLNLNPSVLNQNRVLLNLFPENELAVEIKSRQEKSGGVKIFKGNLEGDPESRVNIVSKGGKTVGNIHTNEGVYEIRYAGNGAHLVRFVDPKLFNERHLRVPVPPPAVSATYVPPPPSQVAEPVVDVVILLTPEAYDAIGGDPDAASALVELMATEANLAYDLSDIGMRVNVPYWAVLSGNVYHDSRDASSDLQTMSDTTPAPGNRLHGFVDDLRDEQDADIVTLLVADAGNDGRTCGIGYMMDEENEASFGNWAYNVVDVDCVSNYSFIHEMGHNMGLGHNREDHDEDDPPRYSYAYGYQDPQERFRTIMAYNCEEEFCQRIPFFSNPNMTYRGIPFGTATEDNARALRNSRWAVANYSESRQAGDGGSSADAASDLRQSAGLENPSGSRLFRNLGRVVQTLFTFNDKKKAELGLKFANEDLLDAKESAEAGDARTAEARLKSFAEKLDEVESAVKKLDEKDRTAAAEIKQNIIENQLKQQALLRALQKEVAGEVKEKIREIRNKETERISRVAPAAKPSPAPLPPTACPRDVKELVCGENNLTYLNPCFAEESNVKIAYKGECKKVVEKEAEKVFCTADYNPVCGADGKTYSNKCVAVGQNKVKIAYEGKCEEKPKAEVSQPTELPYTVCDRNLKDPICGVNGLTYLNKCFAEEANVKIDYVGECKAVMPVKVAEPIPIVTPVAAVCPKDYDLVCGKNGVTYMNECYLKQANAEFAYKGGCAVEPAVVAPKEEAPACSKDVAYVCGTNNLTYLNECFAKLNNVPVAYKGQCQVTSTTTAAPTTEKIAVPTVSVPTVTAIKPVISAFAASPSVIAPKQSSTLSWATSGADSVVLVNTKESLPASGKKTVFPAGTTTYTITASNKAGSVSASVTVYVK